MTIETKFAINQKVYTIYDNVPRVFEIKEIFARVQPLSSPKVSYSGTLTNVSNEAKAKAPGFLAVVSDNANSRHITLTENQLLATKEELAELVLKMVE